MCQWSSLITSDKISSQITLCFRLSSTETWIGKSPLCFGCRLEDVHGFDDEETYLVNFGHFVSMFLERLISSTQDWSDKRTEIEQRENEDLVDCLSYLILCSLAGCSGARLQSEFNEVFIHSTQLELCSSHVSIQRAAQLRLGYG
jgi:hypothetical protein